MALGWEAILRRADGAAPGFRQAFLRAVDEAGRAVNLPALRQALAAGQYDLAASQLDTAWQGAAASWRTTLGPKVLDLLGTVGADAYGSVAAGGAFDLINPRAVAWAQTQAGTLVRNVSQQQLQAIRQIVSSASAGQRTVKGAAAAIRREVLIKGGLGLDPRRAGALATYAARLEQAIAARPTLTAAQRQAALARATSRVERYRTRLLRSRAETIARTETLSAANQGVLEAWRQAEAAGHLPPGLAKRWLTTPDDRRCPLCRPMHGVLARLDQAFVVPGIGPVDRPPAHPSCRCTITLVRPTKGRVRRGITGTPDAPPPALAAPIPAAPIAAPPAAPKLLLLDLDADGDIVVAPIGGAPSGGYGVSLGLGETLPASEATVDNLALYASKHWEDLNQSGHYLTTFDAATGGIGGGPAIGDLTIDVTSTASTKLGALKAAQAAQADTVLDFGAGKALKGGSLGQGADVAGAPVSGGTGSAVAAPAGTGAVAGGAGAGAGGAGGGPPWTVYGTYKNKVTALSVKSKKKLLGATAHELPDGKWELRVPTPASPPPFAPPPTVPPGMVKVEEWAFFEKASAEQVAQNLSGWDPLESTCRHASLSIL